MRLFSHLRQRQYEAATLAVTRQDGMFECYLDWLAAHPDHGPAERAVTILARSPMSPVIRALIGRVDSLKAGGISARALIARIDPEDALREAVDAVAALNPDRPVGELVRWANNTCLLDAHEQLTLGSSMCWSGDMMRRDPGKRDGLDLFETEAPQTVRLGALAFNAIWSIAAPVPASRLRARTTRPSGAYVREPGEEFPKPAFLRQGEEPPAVRH
jgi:hypothetical protein